MQEFPTAALTLAVALALASVHLLSPRLVFLDRTPRSIWLSVAGGISVAYVFVHLLPELAALERETDAGGPLYLYALTGLTIFYALEQLARRQRKGRGDPGGTSLFWLHLVSFALYNFMIGYLLDAQAREEGPIGLLFYALAMGVHFVVNDRALYGHHGRPYLKLGRWVLCAGALLGWAAGLFIVIPHLWLAGLFALLAGSVVLNVIKEELPQERESRLWAFVAGAGAYAALLLLIEGG